ncbi:MAG: glycosyltransferase family 2 protein [Terriglobales bacterium]
MTIVTAFKTGLSVLRTSFELPARVCNSIPRELSTGQKSARMVPQDQFSSQTPLFSIIVAVYNDWTILDGCLQSLMREKEIPFEVIIVDDGSREPAPEYIRQRSGCYPLTILRQDHAGISTARNRGVQRSKGQVLIFVDADSRVQVNCLAALATAIGDFPEYSYFQLRLIGDRSGAIGRAEDLRLMALQDHLLQPNRCIRYLNTAGFAVRRGKLDTEAGLFDPAALRGEDSLLLADLIQREDLPLFVSLATVQHTVPLSFFECLRKDIRSAYLEAGTYDMITSKGVRIWMSNRERFSVLWSAWKASGQDSIGRSAWFVLVARQLLQRMMSLIFRSFRIHPKSQLRLTTFR